MAEFWELSLLFSFLQNDTKSIFLLYQILFALPAPIGLFFGRIANSLMLNCIWTCDNPSMGSCFPGPEKSQDTQASYTRSLHRKVFSFLLFLYFISRVKNVQPGTISAVFLILYGVFRGLIELSENRMCKSVCIGDIVTMGQILCIPMYWLVGAILPF